MRPAAKSASPRPPVRPSPPAKQGSSSKPSARTMKLAGAATAVTASAKLAPKPRGSSSSPPRKAAPQKFSSAAPRSPRVTTSSRMMDVISPRPGTQESVTVPLAIVSPPAASLMGSPRASFYGGHKMSFRTHTSSEVSMFAEDFARGKTSSGSRSAIKVVVRTRPLHSAEIAEGLEPIVTVSAEGNALNVSSEGQGGRILTKTYSFPMCLQPTESQFTVFEICGVKGLLDSALSGYAATVLAYGQTGSGKTYTMTGHDNKTGGFTYETEGIIPRSARYLFNKINACPETPTHVATTADRPKVSTTKVMCTFCEVYNEHVYDLLNLSSDTLPVRWMPKMKRFTVPGLLMVECNSYEDMMTVVTEGLRNRTIGCTALNKDSSRSHSLLTVYLETNTVDPTDGFAQVLHGKVVFVDLAGSERESHSGVQGEAAKETRNINLSLLCLGKVISSLANIKNSSEKQAVSATPAPGAFGRQRGTVANVAAAAAAAHIPYRDSKLTKLLMDSLGGNALTLMIACVSPLPRHLDDTMNTLNYATRAGNIRNKPAIQLDETELLILNLRNEVQYLRKENAFLTNRVVELESSAHEGGARSVSSVTVSSTPTVPTISTSGITLGGGSATPSPPKSILSPSNAGGARQKSLKGGVSFGLDSPADGVTPDTTAMPTLEQLRNRRKSDPSLQVDIASMVKTYTSEIDRLRRELKVEQESRAGEREQCKTLIAENEELSLKLDRKEQELKSLSEEMEGMRVKLAAAAELSTAVASEHDGGGAVGTKGPISAHSSNSAKFFGDPSPDASEWFRDWNGDIEMLKEAFIHALQKNAELQSRLAAGRTNSGMTVKASAFGDVLDTSRELFSVKATLAKTGSFSFGNPLSSTSPSGSGAKRLTKNESGWRGSQLSTDSSPRNLGDDKSSKASSRANLRLSAGSSRPALTTSKAMPSTPTGSTHVIRAFGSSGITLKATVIDEGDDYEDDEFGEDS